MFTEIGAPAGHIAGSEARLKPELTQLLDKIMMYRTAGAPPLSHRGINLLAIVAGGIAALPLAALVAMAAYLVY